LYSFDVDADVEAVNDLTARFRDVAWTRRYSAIGFVGEMGRTYRSRREEGMKGATFRGHEPDLAELWPGAFQLPICPPQSRPSFSTYREFKLLPVNITGSAAGKVGGFFI